MKLILTFSFLTIFSSSFSQEKFERFWSTFTQQASIEEKQSILKYCQFPLKGNIDNPNSENGIYEGELLNHYEHYFNKSFFDLIKKTEAADLTYQDITHLQIEELTFHKGYVLMLHSEENENGYESALIYTFAFIKNKWRLARIDTAGHAFNF